jgi:hypothetical protein
MKIGRVLGEGPDCKERYMEEREESGGERKRDVQGGGRKTNPVQSSWASDKCLSSGRLPVAVAFHHALFFPSPFSVRVKNLNS